MIFNAFVKFEEAMLEHNNDNAGDSEDDDESDEEDGESSEESLEGQIDMLLDFTFRDSADAQEKEDE